MQEIKRIYFYCKQNVKLPYKKEGKYVSIHAIDESEQMKFRFILDQKSYKTTKKELIKSFKKYCLQVKGNCEFLEIISTTSLKDCRKVRDIKSVDYEWDETFSLMLGFGDFEGWWRPLSCVYKERNAHIKHPKPFATIKKEFGYNRKNEPLETKRFWKYFEPLYDKRTFTKEEIRNMYDVIMKNQDVMCRRGHLREKQKMQYALAHLYEHKRELFYKALDCFCESFQREGKEKYPLYAFMKDFPVDYDTLYHYDFYAEAKAYEERYYNYVYYQAFAGAKYGKWLQDFIIQYEELCEILEENELRGRGIPGYV